MKPCAVCDIASVAIVQRNFGLYSVIMPVATVVTNRSGRWAYGGAVFVGSTKLWRQTFGFVFVQYMHSRASPFSVHPAQKVPKTTLSLATCVFDRRVAVASGERY
jgi:hypothetical protein